MKSKFVGLALKRGTKENRDHVWGTYREILLGKNVMSKIIRFYEGGVTSIHRHPLDELVFVELGEVYFLSGENPENLKRENLGPGSLLYAPAGTWHSTRCSRKISDELPFALGIEYQFGEVKGGKYKVDRFNDAKPTTVRKM